MLTKYVPVSVTILDYNYIFNIDAGCSVSDYKKENY